ncbi:MAG: hypothetical protein IJW82_05235 [Clostridia bacterium]|nr:hypothetical protein [Clostridia bacterium]
MISLLNLPYFKNLRQLVKNIVTVEPIKNYVMKEDGNAIKVFLGYEFLMKENKPEVKLPFDDYILKDGIFYFNESENLLLKNGAEGVIKSIGYKGEERYIEILHNGNIKSIYQNVDIVGVNTNLKVQKGQLISTIKPNNDLKFYLTYNEEIITDYTIENGEIIWEK